MLGSDCCKQYVENKVSLTTKEVHFNERGNIEEMFQSLGHNGY